MLLEFIRFTLISQQPQSPKEQPKKGDQKGDDNKKQGGKHLYYLYYLKKILIIIRKDIYFVQTWFWQFGAVYEIPYMWHTGVKWSAVSPVKVSVCVLSPRRTAEGREAITSRHLWRWLWRHCLGPAVVNMGVLGADRAERTSPSLHFALFPRACRLCCCVAWQYSICSPLAVAKKKKINLISIHHHLSFNLFLSPSWHCPL